jgi:2-hydroxychromene-2-carboxylate isomerase
MSRTLTVYYALSSPWTYLGWARLQALAARTGAAVDYRPVRMAEVFAASGGLPLAQRPAQRRAYRLAELRRWRDWLGLPLNLEPRFFPVDERLAAAMVLAHGQAGGDMGALSGALLAAVWAEERDLADPATLRKIAAEQGLDGERLLAAAGSEAVAATYQAYTEAAIAAGVFGAPSFLLDGELYWGQDRLDFVERALG